MRRFFVGADRSRVTLVQRLMVNVGQVTKKQAGPWRRTGGRGASMRRLIIFFATLLVAEQIAIFAWSGVPHDIAQKGRAFSASSVDIARGDTLRFNNEDDFLHQIYVAAPNMSFESNEQPPGELVSVTFPNAGRYEVHCHIHPKMSLIVNVK
jgi:plastocyanin